MARRAPPLLAAALALAAALPAAFHAGCVLATPGLEGSDGGGPAGAGGSGPTSSSSSAESATSASAQASSSASAQSSTSSSTVGAGGAGGGTATAASSASSSASSASSSSGSGGSGVGPTFCGDADHLIACYPLDGSYADGSPHAATLEVQGSPSFVGGRAGQGLQLDGAEVKVSNGATWNHDPATVELWLNPITVPAAGERAAIVDAGGAYSVFLYGPAPGNGPSVIRCNAGFSVFGAVPLPAGEWTHVACVFETDPGDPAKVRITLYVDGFLDTVTSFNGAFVPATTDVFIGSNDPDGLAPFDGIVDGLRAFDVARTAQEICVAAGNLGC